MALRFLLPSRRRAAKEQTGPSIGAGSRPQPATRREDNAIYQGEKLVARVQDPEVDGEAGEIRFGEIYHSDDLLLPEECEFQNHRIMVRRIEFASRIDRNAPEKGRVLKGVVAEILGYIEH